MTESLKCQSAVQSFAEWHRRSILGSDLKVLQRSDPSADDTFYASGKKVASAIHPSSSASSVSSVRAPGSGNAKNSSSVYGNTNPATTATSAPTPAKSGKSNKKSTNKPSKSAEQTGAAYGSAQSLTVKRGVVHKGGGRQSDLDHAAASAFDIPVFNCLFCGKVRLLIFSPFILPCVAHCWQHFSHVKILYNSGGLRSRFSRTSKP
jgi:hypothetical protein